MSRQLRLFSCPRPTTVEITRKTFQSRYLMRPSPQLNRRIVGALAKAQEAHPARIHGFVFLSDHFHLLATFNDVAQMAGFMHSFTCTLSREIRLATGWKGSVFHDRYRSIELSPEPEIELARLRYIFSNSCKENLVASPLAWPGVSSAEASVSGNALDGEWIHRTPLCHAERGKRSVSEEDFARSLTLRLDPLPSLRHLSVHSHRRIMADLVRQVEEETAKRHAFEKTLWLGAEKILAKDPLSAPREVVRSPAPKCHAASKKARQALLSAVAQIVGAYRRASERLKAGERNVRFPANTFPPPLPFVHPHGIGAPP